MKNSQARDSAVGDGQAQVRDRALAGLSALLENLNYCFPAI